MQIGAVQGEDRLAHLLVAQRGQPADGLQGFAWVAVRWGFTLAFEYGLSRQTDAEQGLGHAVVQLAGDALALVIQQAVALRGLDLATQALQPRDHVALLFVQFGVADGDRHLIGEDRQQPLLLLVVPAVTVGHAEHADDLGAEHERCPQKGPHRWMAARRADVERVVGDIVGEVRLAGQHDDAEDARADGNGAKPRVKGLVVRDEPFDGRHVHLIGTLHQADEAEF